MSVIILLCSFYATPRSLCFASLPIPVHAQTLKTDYKIDFSSANTLPYSDDRGYGFESSAVEGRKGFVTSDKPFYFSAAVPEGNYRVTVKLGDPEGESTTTIKAEFAG